MKTNQIMKREKGFVQRTQDGYFNATDLLNHYNEKYEGKRQLQSYKNNKEFKEFVEQLQKEGIEKPFIASRGKHAGGTWMHPKLFIDFAMWLDVRFKSKVIDMVLDGLIQSRHNAGDYYNQMCAATMIRYVDYFGRKPPATIYQTEANRIKELLGINKDRNNLSKEELDNLTMLQKVNTQMIVDGMGLTKRVTQLRVFAKALTGVDVNPIL